MSVHSLMPCMSSHQNIILESEDAMTALIGLGANLASDLGSPTESIYLALLELGRLSLTEICASALYESEAIGCPPGSPNFINAVVAISLPRDHDAEVLLDLLQNIERDFGRAFNRQSNAPRSLDLDLLCFGSTVISSPRLDLPHPRATLRRFVLEPLAEIAPDLILPGQIVPVRELLDCLPPKPWVRRLSGI
jgi:2-amino-4-hydroxy-6-hydroxymethyldihydropteridine diphosphokinase